MRMPLRYRILDTIVSIGRRVRCAITGHGWHYSYRGEGGPRIRGCPWCMTIQQEDPEHPGVWR